MSEIVVGPLSAKDEIAARFVGVPVDDLAFIQFGKIGKGSVTAWVGVEPPVGPDALYVELKAPEPAGREPSAEWAYVHHGRWSWDPEGAESCFNHADLVAVRVKP